MRVEVRIMLFLNDRLLMRSTRACYLEGQLVPVKPGSTADPKPSAGNNGTTIIVSI